MVLSPQILSILVLLALGLSVLAVVLIITAQARRGAPTTEEEIVNLVREHDRVVGRLRASVGKLGKSDTRLADLVQTSIQRVALVRFDAFEDMGGQMSFSAALLDAKGDGIVFTSINGRNDTRVYAKPVRAGVSRHNLSDEEVQAIRLALTGRQGAAAVS